MARSRRALSTLRNSMIDCSKVHVRPDRHGGLGAFAACNIASGEALTHARGSSNRSSNRHTSTIVDHTSNTPMCSLQSPLIMTVAAAQVVEKGVARVLTNVDGNENPCAAPVLCQALTACSQPVAPPPWAGTSSLGRTRCRIGHLRDTTSRDGHLQDTSLASQVPNEHWAVGSGCATFYNTCGHEEESAASSTYDICTYLIS